MRVTDTIKNLCKCYLYWWCGVLLTGYSDIPLPCQVTGGRESNKCDESYFQRNSSIEIKFMMRYLLVGRMSNTVLLSLQGLEGGVGVGVGVGEEMANTRKTW